MLHGGLENKEGMQDKGEGLGERMLEENRPQCQIL